MLEHEKSLPPSQLAQKAYALYGKFRLRFLRAKKGRGPTANWTWTSSARWLSPHPKERLSCPILDATNRVEYGGRISASQVRSSKIISELMITEGNKQKGQS
jgi:hypothetical protein